MSSPSVLRFEDLYIGLTVSFDTTITERDLDAFSTLSGDWNPLHTDPDFALRRGHRGRVVHGMLLASLLSRVAGMHIPGRDCLLQSVQLDFVSPAYVGDTIRLAAEVTQLQAATRVVSLRVRFTRGADLIARGKVLAGLYE